MKTLKILSIITLVFLFSCEDYGTDELGCYTCKTKTENNVSTQVICDITEREITLFEQQNSFTSSVKIQTGTEKVFVGSSYTGTIWINEYKTVPVYETKTVHTSTKCK